MRSMPSVKLGNILFMNYFVEFFNKNIKVFLLIFGIPCKVLREYAFGKEYGVVMNNLKLKTSSRDEKNESRGGEVDAFSNI